MEPDPVALLKRANLPDRLDGSRNLSDMGIEANVQH